MCEFLQKHLLLDPMKFCSYTEAHQNKRKAQQNTKTPVNRCNKAFIEDWHKTVWHTLWGNICTAEPLQKYLLVHTKIKLTTTTTSETRLAEAIFTEIGKLSNQKLMLTLQFCNINPWNCLLRNISTLRISQSVLMQAVLVHFCSTDYIKTIFFYPP